ncbi:hypothetical protein [Falsiruegeria mediterranea]|uniref:Lipoprotein n=1 Tax=Falsiruegeria mediterranea M17 TaxID=1200281 RepID=A0A2R8C5X5_9RHOB|nr:hypothetical protein [Falsiruegeria mediterranea]SPJ27841.1 hypothetical protein TRM7615_01334 [Falsiruegeria mediterranea M17]
MTLIRTSLALICLVVLAGCGADGEPVQPSLNAHAGVGGGSSYVGGSVGLHRGPFNLYLGF